MVDIFICGDIINQFSENNFIGPQMMSIIKDADYSIGNFEGVLPYDGMNCFGMVQMPTTLDTLKSAGFKMLLLSNNHIGDYGKRGFSHTLSEIDKMGFDRTGAGFTYEEAYTPLIKEINGVRFGFLNVCEAICCLFKSPARDFGSAWTGAKILEHIIPDIKKRVDYLIVLPHSGLELYDYPLEHTKELYHHYCDLGADLIVAAHPHVPQGIEKYKGHHIFYSLGNFYFPETVNCNSSLKTNQSFSIVLTFGDDRSITYKVIYHKIENLTVEVCEKPEKDVEVLSSLLQEPLYSENVGKQNEYVFDNVVFNLYKDAIFGMSRSLGIVDKLKLALRLLRPVKEEQAKSYIKSLHKITQSETYINLIDSAINRKKLS